MLKRHVAESRWHASSPRDAVGSKVLVLDCTGAPKKSNHLSHRLRRTKYWHADIPSQRTSAGQWANTDSSVTPPIFTDTKSGTVVQPYQHALV